jgi:hypothetical protein
MDVLVRIIAGDTGPDLEFTILDADGAAVNITGSTPYLAFGDDDDSYEYTFRKTCVITNGAAGICEFRWVASGETIPAFGKYLGQMQIENLDSKNQSSEVFPISIGRKLVAP